jgi:hypothetical protein
MTFKKYWVAAVAVGVLSIGISEAANGQTNAGTSQNAQAPASETSSVLGSGAILQAELSKGLDVKKAKLGDTVEAKLTQDMKANGKVLLRRGSKLLGHVTDVQVKSGETAARLGFMFDKAALKGGEEIAFNGVVMAVAPPLEGSSEIAGDPGSLSSAPSVGGQPFGAGHSMGGPSASSAPAVNSATTRVTSSDGANGPPRNTGAAANGALTPASRGALGLDGVTLNQATIHGVQGTLLVSAHNIKLDGGTQLVLQVAGPVAAK